MKLQILQENLNKGLSVAFRTISTKAQLPILANVLLKTNKNNLQISATNLETGINIKLGAKIEKEGEITIPAKVLTEVIASLSTGKVDLVLKDNILNIASNGYEASFNGISATEFPKLPTYDPENLFSLPSEKLLESINQVAFAAAVDEGRPVLTGVLLKLEGKTLSLVATDGYRLSLKTIETETPIKEKITLLLPAKSLMEVARIITETKDGKEKMIKMGFTKEQNQVVFVFPEMDLFTRVIEGEFPDFEKIIPKSFSTKITLDRETFSREVKLVSIFARDSSNIIKFKVKSGLLEMSANSPQIGDNKSLLENKMEGEETEIAFNYRFLQGFLAAVSSSEVSMEMAGATSSGLLRPVGDNSFLHIIMPVRLQTE
ncbi:DNA polymerase III subunit beta [Candidatus Shapirobacteria bacterium CG09_land_8_20_14_0_10_39_12]|uniref:Beta sliding clamp n=1 Tax=Candidatus Shapirobacteria bacterium CG09_land_8_20_14_0_10_39_12 TaxID=1974885 RepID=A0A2H0WQD4_9BACT|nr:MAG: DNA polymerase III subunit beta [Candidatus Shapirobacteria bacterium CG09_land_8_20_14_0_10_39_12]